MPEDRSSGWEDVAEQFIARRCPDVGLSTVIDWAGSLEPGASLVDIGCGSGLPISAALVERGFTVAGIDASPTLAAAYRSNFPDALVACEAAEDSTFFGQSFDGALAIGLVFLLPEQAQHRLLGNVAAVLRPGGRFLFTAPEQACEWNDLMTGRRSVSLGAREYEKILAGEGLTCVAGRIDEGENHYFEAIKPAV